MQEKVYKGLQFDFPAVELLCINLGHVVCTLGRLMRLYVPSIWCCGETNVN